MNPSNAYHNLNFIPQLQPNGHSPTQTLANSIRHNTNSNSARSEPDFYATLRRYTERIREERNISLEYLNKINELTEQLRQRDIEIERLNKVNRELSDKLGVYTSVLSRSRAKKSMHMSMLLGQNKLTESIIETKQEYQGHDSLKSFEQFFILDISQHAFPSSRSSEPQPMVFTYLFDPDNSLQEIITNCLRGNSGPTWELEPFGTSTSERREHRCLFLSNSIFTTQREKQPRLRALDDINPSYYYYISCIVQKEIVSINGRYFWAPVAYGFVSMLPFPDYFMGLLEQIIKEVKIKKESDRNRLSEGLLELDKCPVELGRDEIQYVFHFLSNKNHVWKMPSLSSVDAYSLSFSVRVLQNFALELVIDVLILLLLEIPITVVSQDELLLCQFMFYFVYILKPLKYPFPIVFNLNAHLATLLESPFPTFTGTTSPKLVDPFLNERAVFDLDNKVAKSWPMLGHLDSSREFLMRIAQRAGGFTKLGVVTEAIIKGHQYRELEPYWKDFSSTQIYKNFVYDG